MTHDPRCDWSAFEWLCAAEASDDPELAESMRVTAAQLQLAGASSLADLYAGSQNLPTAMVEVDAETQQRVNVMMLDAALDAHMAEQNESR